jgi:hypothetical protein
VFASLLPSPVCCCVVVIIKSKLQSFSYFLVSRNRKTLNGVLSWVVVNGMWYQLLFEYWLCKLMSMFVVGPLSQFKMKQCIAVSFFMFFLVIGCTWSKINGKHLPYEFRTSLGVQYNSVIQNVHVKALTEHGMSWMPFCHNKYLFILLEFTVFSMHLAAIFAWYKWVFSKWYSMEHWVSVKEKKFSSGKLHCSIKWSFAYHQL